jgi:hypothetical protein
LGFFAFNELAFCFTHWVTPEIATKPLSCLGFGRIHMSQLRFLGLSSRNKRDNPTASLVGINCTFLAIAASPIKSERPVSGQGKTRIVV